MSDTLKHYLRDFVYLLKEEENNFKMKSNLNDFDEGIKFTYHIILEKLKNQAESFQIELEEIGFYDFEKYMKKKETGHNKR